MSRRAEVTLSQLEAFLTAANAGSVTAAASALHTSQSNVSVAIANLEKTLGVELLVRRPAKGVALTPAGSAIARQGWEVLEAVRTLQDEARGEREGLEGELRVGSFLPLTPFYLPALIEDFAARAPGVELRFHEATLDELHRGVLEGDLDIAIVYDQALPATLAFHELARVHPYVIAPPGSGLASLQDVSLLELSRSGMRMVTYAMPLTVARTERLFTSAGVPVPPEVRVAGLDTVRALVAAGVGFAIMNQRWATSATADGRQVATVDLRDAVTPMGLGVVSRRMRPTAKIALAIESVRTQALTRHPPATVS